MKTNLILWIAAGCLAALTALSQQPSPPPAVKQPAEEALNNNSVIEMKQVGLGETVLIEKIRTSRCEFDTSISGLKQLKIAGVSDAVIAAMLSVRGTVSGGSAAPPVSDPNDPESPHDAGIWLFDETGKSKMIQLEPSVYSQHKSGVGFFMAYGQTVKNRAVIRSAHAELRTASRMPVFYFYFEHTKSGLSDTHGATTPNEYILAQFEVAEKDNERRLVMSAVNAYSGVQQGAESKSVRSIGFQKLSPGIYKVTPKQPLADGEYGFFFGGTSHGGGKVFDFGMKGVP